VTSHGVCLTRRGAGLHLSNLASAPTTNDDFSMADCLGMLLLDTVLFLILNWYLDKVFPGPFGMPHSPIFFLKPSYWGCTKTKLKAEVGAKQRSFILAVFDVLACARCVGLCSMCWPGVAPPPRQVHALNFVPKPTAAAKLATSGGLASVRCCWLSAATTAAKSSHAVPPPSTLRCCHGNGDNPNAPAHLLATRRLPCLLGTLPTASLPTCICRRSGGSRRPRPSSAAPPIRATLSRCPTRLKLVSG
jgi:hypothetical protein